MVIVSVFIISNNYHNYVRISTWCTNNIIKQLIRFVRQTSIEGRHIREVGDR